MRFAGQKANCWTKTCFLLTKKQILAKQKLAFCWAKILLSNLLSKFTENVTFLEQTQRGPQAPWANSRGPQAPGPRGPQASQNAPKPLEQTQGALRGRAPRSPQGECSQAEGEGETFHFPWSCLPKNTIRRVHLELQYRIWFPPETFFRCFRELSCIPSECFSADCKKYYVF